MRKTVQSKAQRTKRDVASDYLKDLINFKVVDVKEHEFEAYLDSNQDALLTSITEKLYETERINGQEVSSVDAFYHFCEYVVGHDPITKKKIWNKFVKEQFELIEHHQLACYMAPRGHGKSFVSFVLYPIFKGFLVPYFDAILCSNTPKMVRINFRKLVRIIDGNEFLLEKKASELGRDLTWNESEIEYNNGFIYTLSIGTTPRGGHVCYVVGDDPLRDDNKYSYEHTLNFFLGQLKPTILRRKGRMVISGTPQSQKDLFHTLMADKSGKLITDGAMSSKGFASRVFKAILDHRNKTVLVPEIFTYDQLIQEKEVQGDVYFNREFMCECVSDETTLFPYSLIKDCTDEDFKIIDKGEKDKNYVIAADVATSAEASADYSAFIVLEIIDDVKRGLIKIIRNIVWVKGMKVSEQIDTLEDLSIRFNNAYTLVEKNNVGVALIQQLQDKNVNVEEFVTDKFKKESMIRFLSNEMRRRRLIFPESTFEVDALKKEMENFGVKIKSGREVMEAISGHDDLVISLALCNQATQTMSNSLPMAVVQD